MNLKSFFFCYIFTPFPRIYQRRLPTASHCQVSFNNTYLAIVILFLSRLCFLLIYLRYLLPKLCQTRVFCALVFPHKTDTLYRGGKRSNPRSKDFVLKWSLYSQMLGKPGVSSPVLSRFGHESLLFSIVFYCLQFTRRTRWVFELFYVELEFL